MEVYPPLKLRLGSTVICPLGGSVCLLRAVSFDVLSGEGRFAFGSREFAGGGREFVDMLPSLNLRLWSTVGLPLEVRVLPFGGPFSFSFGRQ